MKVNQDDKVDQKIKVIFSSPSVSRLYTGVFEVSRNLALELIKSDIDVEIHSLIDKHTNDDLEAWSPLLPNTHKVFGPNSIGYSLTYYDSLIASNSSVGHIHALWSYTSYALFKWSRTVEKGYLLSANGYLDPWALANSGVKKNIAFKFGYRSIIEDASCIQVNSSFEYDSIRNLGLVSPICMISNGVVLPDLDIQQDRPWPTIEQGRKILLFLGRIDKKKGVDLLLSAWSSIINKSENKDWNLVLVGFNDNPTTYELSVKSFIKKNGLKDNITCLNGMYGNDMEACYRNCDAFILPSFSEGASISVLNAWAFSKPVIATDECGFPDAVSYGSAIKVETNLLSVETGILKCIEMNDKDRLIMGQMGRKLVALKYSWKSVANEISKIYKWIISKDNDRPESLIE